MALKDLVPTTETIEIGATSIEIRGLSISDLAGLLDRHKDALAEFFEAEKPSLDLVSKFSDAVAAVIAHAAGEPDQEEQVQLIALGDQLKVIEAIWRLTNISPEQVGNLMSGVVGGLRKFNVQSLALPSTNGSVN